ncbi:MAG: ACP S-malonyltransferase [Gemmatimonadota bacterium]
MAGCAFLYPGQASQVVGMARDLYALSAAVRELFDQADQVLGLPLTRLCFEGPAEELAQTAVTQPAVFVHSVAATRLLVAGGVHPSCAAGHSLGEYSALVAAGVLDFGDALQLVGERARLMQQAGEAAPGKMAAVIGLEDDAVVRLCAEVGEAVVPANFNAPGQVVVSGEAAAVDALAERARQAGAKRVIELPVSGAFHSPLMAPAARELEQRLRSVPMAPPRVPILTNVAADAVRDVEELRRQLIRQMTSPVRWTQILRRMVDMGVSRAAEVGPGSVLKGLGRRAAPELEVYPAGTTEDIPRAIETLGRHGGG